MKSYTDLEVYETSKKLAIQMHKMTLVLPKFEQYEEGSQVRRSSKAVTCAIVEGFSRRRYKNEFIRYLIMAHAECDETRIHLKFLHETASLKDHAVFRELDEAYESLSKKINRFAHWVENEYNVVR